MAKKRGLAANRGLDALLGSIKKEKQITAAALQDDILNTDQTAIDDDASVMAVNAGKNNASQPNPNQPNTSKTVGKTSPAVKSVANNRQISPEDEISLVQIDVQRLQAGKYQPRRDMSESALTELASSIKQHGVMQPIVIRPLLAKEDKTHPKVTHEIIAGERRWRAAKLAGMSVIPAIERALSDELAIALALIENIQREDLSVIEQAAALQRFNTEFGMSHAMIADVVGKARTTVSNLLRLNQLHDTVKDYLADNSLDMGHARALLPLSKPQQPVIAKKIIDGGLTVRAAEKLVKSILNPQAKDKKAHNSLTNQHEVECLAQQLSEKLGATVKLKQKSAGKGSMEIFFHSEDELNALLAHLKAE